MTLEKLITWLTHLNPDVRRQSALILGMVQEKDALAALQSAYAAETDDAVKNAMSQAMTRIQNTPNSTVDRLFEHFQIDQEIENLPEDFSFDDVQLFAQMDQTFRDDLHKSVSDQSKNVHVRGMRTGSIGGGQFSALNASNELLGSQTNQITKRRIPATAPNPDSPQHLLKRLVNADTNEQVLRTLRELVEYNNPYTLPHIFELVLNHPDTNVQQGAMRAGNEIYLMMRYWNMTQNGSLKTEYNRRLAQKRTS